MKRNYCKVILEIRVCAKRKILKENSETKVFEFSIPSLKIKKKWNEVSNTLVSGNRENGIWKEVYHYLPP